MKKYKKYIIWAIIALVAYLLYKRSKKKEEEAKKDQFDADVEGVIEVNPDNQTVVDATLKDEHFVAPILEMYATPNM